MTSVDITFIPVKCSRGRKWCGELAYQLSILPDLGPHCSLSFKLWDPLNKKISSATESFVENIPDNEINVKQLEIDKKEYILYRIKNTIEWCRERSVNESETLRFARNILNKYNPNLVPIYNKLYASDFDIVTEIEHTLRWAMNRKTSSVFMYGKFRGGGKPISDINIIRIAYSALEKKGITKLDGFEDVWLFITNLFKLPGDQVFLPKTN